MYHFRQLALWGWLNSILITPLVWLVLVLGLLKTSIAVVMPSAASLLGRPLAWLTDLLVRVVQHLQVLPGSGTPTPTIPLWLTIAMLGIVAVWTIWPRLHLSKWWLIGTAAAVLLGGVCHLLPWRQRETLTLTVPGAGSTCQIVITTPAFRDALKPLIVARAQQGLRVAVLDVDQVYDAFAAGRAGPDAIRALVRPQMHGSVRRLVISPVR